MPPRNLLIVLTHGLRTDAISDADYWPLKTPHWVDLAERGFRSTAIAASPADPASMIGLLTGLHARQHGAMVQGAAAPVCEGWPAALREEGYHLVGVGRVELFERWLHESIPVQPVDDMTAAGCRYLDAMKQQGLLSIIIDQRRQRQRMGLFEPDRLMLDDADDVDGFIGAEACRALDRMPTDRPWALVVSFTGPANDLPPPTGYEAAAPSSRLEIGYGLPDFRQLDDQAELDYPRIFLQRLEPHQLARIRADYLGRVSQLDDVVGRLTALMRGRDDAERSWIVTASDRGFLLGDQGLVGHRSFLTGAVETPITVTPPQRMTEYVAMDQLSTIDVAATIAHLGGCDPLPGTVGRSVAPLLAQEPLTHVLPGGVALSEFGSRLMIETERYRAIFSVIDQSLLGLWDLVADPNESSSIAGSAVGRDLADSMRSRLAEALLGLRAAPPVTPHLPRHLPASVGGISGGSGTAEADQ